MVRTRAAAPPSKRPSPLAVGRRSRFGDAGRFVPWCTSRQSARRGMAALDHPTRRPTNGKPQDTATVGIPCVVPWGPRTRRNSLRRSRAEWQLAVRGVVMISRAGRHEISSSPALFLSIVTTAGLERASAAEGLLGCWRSSGHGQREPSHDRIGADRGPGRLDHQRGRPGRVKERGDVSRDRAARADRKSSAARSRWLTRRQWRYCHAGDQAAREGRAGPHAADRDRHVRRQRRILPETGGLADTPRRSRAVQDSSRHAGWIVCGRPGSRPC